MRRRTVFGDEDRVRGLHQPLLSDYQDHDEGEEKEEEEELHKGHSLNRRDYSRDQHLSGGNDGGDAAGVVVWQQVLALWVAHCTAWLRTVMTGTGAAVWASVAGLLLRGPNQAQIDRSPVLPPLKLSPEQEASWQQLRQRLNVAFDSKNPQHLDALRSLWQLAFPHDPLPEEEREEGGGVALPSEKWKEMGWQGKNPVTDLRGGGFLALQNLIFFAKKYPASFRRLMLKEEGHRASWEYPFAAAGVNITATLTQKFDLSQDTPRSDAGRHFTRFLHDDPAAFDELFCVFFELLDAKWLSLKASYMEFNVVMKATVAQFEQELSEGSPKAAADLPSYKLLLQ